VLILPAIDLRNGQCVRLYQGKEHMETVYSKDPVEMAEHWASLGAKMLHVADLDGAFKGKPVNIDLVKKMKDATQLPVQMGGGFRDLDSIDQAIQAGVDRVILGTAAVYDPDLVKESVNRYGSAMAVSIDVSDDFVAVAGWKELSTVRFDDLAHRMRDIGIQHLLFTDTRKDGTLSGPNIPSIKLFLKAAQVPVTVSGGISSVDDVKTLLPLASEGLQGIVIGKALYDHKIHLEDALAAARASL
jgi:phosphoribosylformimino-5-aminoimidazole carboxamide ribotide isomerase